MNIIYELKVVKMLLQVKDLDSSSNSLLLLFRG